jgi:prepilin-type processing-associated H-X9-DG protein
LILDGRHGSGHNPAVVAFPVHLQKEFAMRSARAAGTAAVILGLALAALVPAAAQDKAGGDDKARAANMLTSQNNLKQIGLALHAHHDAFKSLPPQAICDKTGKPLLSWRVLILPFVEQAELYKQFKLDEPWDGPNNSKLLAKMPELYAAPGIKTREPGLTYYQGFVGTGAGMELMPDPKKPFGARGLRLVADIKDGTTYTIAVVEAGEPVPWTKPADLPYEKGKLPKIGGVFKGPANALMFDGSVVTIIDGIRPATLEAAITRNGGEPLQPGWEKTK